MIRYHGNAVAHGTTEFGSACLLVGILICGAIVASAVWLAWRG